MSELSYINKLIDSRAGHLTQVVRDGYLDLLNYLTSIDPNFVINKDRVAELDKNMSIKNGYTWPNNLKEIYNKNDVDYLDKLISYRGVSLGIRLSKTGLFIKFPTIELRVRKVDSYTLRRWRRENTGVNTVFSVERAYTWETVALSQSRLPTSQEFVDGMGYGFYGRTRSEMHSLQLDIGPGADISKQVEALYIKYTKNLNKRESAEEASIVLGYKLYLKLRGNRALAATLAAKPKQV
jgi:hypothetical protein